jgi:hypothetical protein
MREILIIAQNLLNIIRRVRQKKERDLSVWL